jgi:hypothetical protein
MPRASGCFSIYLCGLTVRRNARRAAAAAEYVAGTQPL